MISKQLNFIDLKGINKVKLETVALGSLLNLSINYKLKNGIEYVAGINKNILIHFMIKIKFYRIT